MGAESGGAGKMSHEGFLNWVQKKLEKGWQVYSCYEAGASGYWLHRLRGYRKICVWVTT